MLQMGEKGKSLFSIDICMSNNVVLDKYFIMELLMLIKKIVWSSFNLSLKRFIMADVLMFYELSNGQDSYSQKKTEDAHFCYHYSY